MENNQGYDRQDLIPGWPFFAVHWFVGSVVRTGHLGRVIRLVQGAVTDGDVKWLSLPAILLTWEIGWIKTSKTNKVVVRNL